ncbi:MAG: DUF1294 domain-containing protein [Gammaproteobacteria bacterium]|nr:DUF1294 domain-containing protein [Gammaproteobacteria bacterium]
MKRWIFAVLAVAFIGVIAAVHIIEAVSPVLISYILVMGLIGYVVFYIDKRRAEREQSRIPEDLLLLIAAAGGWVGASFAKLQFHHKTSQVSFQLKYFAAIVLNLALIYLVFWLF